MKTTIIISGQISGNLTLRNKLAGNSIEEKRTMFNGSSLLFNTKKDAVAAIREAYNDLIADEPELKGSMSGIRASKDRTELYYDASKAIMNKNK